MTSYSSRTFRQLFDRDSAAVFFDLTFNNCEFNNCGLSLTQSVELMTQVRNVKAIGCKCINCHVGPAVFEDVLFDGLAIDDMLVLNAPLFRRVTLRGNIGRVLINRNAGLIDYNAEVQRIFDAARNSFYSDVDWALDISEARFREFEVDGVPARLIRRDPKTQVVVTRERASKPGWREQLSPQNTFWPFVLGQFLNGDDPDVVLVAPKSARKQEFNSLVDGLNELRQLGIAEPD